MVPVLLFVHYFVSLAGVDSLSPIVILANLQY